MITNWQARLDGFCAWKMAGFSRDRHLLSGQLLSAQLLTAQYSTGMGSRLRHRYHVATDRHGCQGLAIDRIFSRLTGSFELQSMLKARCKPRSSIGSTSGRNI